MGVGNLPTSIIFPTTYGVAKNDFGISNMYMFRKNKKIPYALDPQVA